MKKNFEFSAEELDVLKKAISYLYANVPDAEEAFDEQINSEEVKALEEKIYTGSNNNENK